MDRAIIEYTWFPLTMTSNTTPLPYTISASSNQSIAFPYLAFDGKLNSDSRWFTNVPTGYITVDFGTAKLFNCLKYSCSAIVTTAYPNLVTIQGSIDGTNFIDIATFNGTNTATEFMTIEFENKTKFRYYRFNIKSNFGHASYTGLTELVYGFIKKTTNKTFILHEGDYKKWIPKNLDKGEAIIQNMISYTSNIGTVSAGNEYSGRSPWKAFDGVNSNYGNSWQFTFPSWLKFDFTIKQNIGGYSIKCIDSETNYMSKSWTFEITEDGSTWVVADTQNNLSWIQGEEKTFFFPTNYECIGFRINVTDSTSSTYARIGEMNVFYGIEKTTPHWSTVSPTLPTSTQFLEKGMDTISPLLDRRVETLNPTNMTIKNDVLEKDDVGKVFSKPLDLKKYFDIRSIRTEVK